MGADLLTIILIDNTTPIGDQAFSCHPAIWDLRQDHRLSGCKDYRFISAISGLRSEGGFCPLHTLRGLPAEMADWLMPDCKLHFDENPGWLNAEELNAAITHAGLDRSMLADPVNTLLRVIDCLAEIHGKDRVRLVFDIWSA